MKKIDESNQISEAVDTIVGEVISDEKPNDGKRQTGLKKRDTYAFGSFITKSNDLIQRTNPKYYRSLANYRKRRNY